MKMILLAALLLLFSCSRGHDLESYENIYFLKNIDANVNRVEVLDWHVGINKEKIISKGFVLNQDLIELSTETKEILSSKFRADSWLYHFYRINRQGKKETLGWVSIAFDRIGRHFQDFSVIVFYGAASISRRYRTFKCPAFSHRKKIQSLDIKSSGDEVEKLFVGRTETITADINNGQYFPIIFNGGVSLEGDYFVEVALYSSTLRVAYSKWIQLQDFLRIEKEMEVSVTSCIGINEEKNPLPSSKMPSLEDFQIK